MRKKGKQIFLLLFLIVFYSYVLVIQAMPNELVIFEGETISLKTIFGLQLQESDDHKMIQTSSTMGKTALSQTGTTTLKLSLFDQFFIKDVNVNILPRTTVIPAGNIAGVKLYTNGVLVVGMSEIEGTDHKKYKPYENSGIQEGDRIISMNENKIFSTQDLMDLVNRSNGKNIEVQYQREEQTMACSITPVQTSSNQYKLGLWVRDSAAGVGTVTFYEPSSKTFGALGHGIVDIDTEQLIDISSGEFVTTRILNITKGESGNPGRVQGTVENQTTIGTIAKNTKFGIYGTVNQLSSLKIDASKEMEVALRDEIKVGAATILCSLDNDKVQEYTIEIEEIFKDNNYNNKSMKIKITDQTLLDKTGGIIQGMSGSPILQNGKFVGAVTHVLVNNPKEGYGVFGDIMLKQAKMIQ